MTKERVPVMRKKETETTIEFYRVHIRKHGIEKRFLWKKSVDWWDHLGNANATSPLEALRKVLAVHKEYEGMEVGECCSKGYYPPTETNFYVENPKWRAGGPLSAPSPWCHTYFAEVVS